MKKKIFLYVLSVMATLYLITNFFQLNLMNVDQIVLSVSQDKTLYPERNISDINADKIIPIDHNSEEIHVFTVPGVFNTGEFFKPLITVFEKSGYICHALTLPDRDTPFSKTPPDIGNISIYHDSEWVYHKVSLVKQNNPLAKITLIGHSRGGLLIQMVADQAKQHVTANMIDAIILLNPATPKGISLFTLSNIWCFQETLISGSFWNKPAKRSLNLSRNFVLHPDVSEVEAKNINKEHVWESGEVLAELAFPWLKPDIPADVFSCPVLIVGGTLDVVVAPSKVNQLGQKYKNADIKFFETAHYPFWGEEESRIIQFIDSWIQTRLNIS